MWIFLLKEILAMLHVAVEISIRGSSAAVTFAAIELDLPLALVALSFMFKLRLLFGWNLEEFNYFGCPQEFIAGDLVAETVKIPDLLNHSLVDC